MGNSREFAISLKTDGSGTVRQDFAGVADAAEQSTDRMAKAYDKAGAAAERAAQKEKARLDALKAQANALFNQSTYVEPATSSPRVSGTPASSSAPGSPVEQRLYQATAQKLIDAIDPAAKAQRTFNTEMEAASSLMQRGYISSDQYAAYVTKLREELALATRAGGEHGTMLGLNRMQYITAQSAVLRFTDSIIAGQSPLRAFALEAHKGVEILSLDEGGMAGGLSKVAGLINPATVGITLLTAGIIASGIAAYDYAAQLDKMEAAASGFGRTSQLSGNQLMQLAQANSEAGKVSVKAAEEVETAILAQTRTSADALGEAIRIAQKFGDAMGIDAKKAAEDLGKALADPAKGADELAQKYGYLTQVQVEHIHQLMEQNRLTEAQEALLHDLGGQLDNAGDHVSALTKLFRALFAAVSDGWDRVGAAVNRMMGNLSNAEKLKALQEKIGSEQASLTGGSLAPRARALTEAQLKADMTAYAEMAAGQRNQDAGARNNQLGEEARNIVAKYNLDPSVSPKLENLKQELATLEQAQRAGQHVDGSTIDALRHAVRTFMTPDQQRVAIQTAQADMRRAAPHSRERELAAQRLKDAQTAGQVITEGAADDLSRERGLAALGHGKTGGDHSAEARARESAAMVAEAQASLQLADAYLKGGDAALINEARRKAVTDATRKGIDVEAQFQRQLALTVAEQIASSAKGIRATEDETAARNRVLSAISAGKVPEDQMQQALARETALRPLLTLQAVAQGDALGKLTSIIDIQTKALNDNEEAQRRFAAQQAISAGHETARAESLRASLASLRDPAWHAREQAMGDGQAKGWSAVDTLAYANSQGEAASAKQKADSAEWLANEQHRSALAMQLLSAQSSGDQATIARQTLLNQLDEKRISLTEDQISAVLAAQQAEKKWDTQIRQQQQLVQQFRDTGSSAMEQILSPDGLEHWGATWKKVLRQILTEIEQLAIVKPLINSLFGSASGGGGGGLLGSLFGSLFGGGSSIASSVASLQSTEMSTLASSISIPAFASGTDSAPGGAALVGENGPELVNLPRGAGVLTASETKAAMSSGEGNILHMPITINAQGAGPREVDALRLEMQALRRDMPGIAIAANNNARQRRMVS